MLEKLDIVTRAKVLEMALDVAARDKVQARYGEEDTLVEDLVEGWKKYWVRDILIAMYCGNIGDLLD